MAGMTRLDAWEMVRQEWRLDKSNVICKLMQCDCPSTEYGMDSTRTICTRAAAFIEGLEAIYFAQNEAAKVMADLSPPKHPKE
jgi:hypothetical protein